MLAHSPRAFPWEIEPPVGNHHVKVKRRPKARARRPRERTCVNKKCGRKYHASRWNQRYCQDPECMREVNRWLAARRQAERRKVGTAKAQHTQAEKAPCFPCRSVPAVVKSLCAVVSIELLVPRGDLSVKSGAGSGDARPARPRRPGPIAPRFASRIDGFASEAYLRMSNDWTPTARRAKCSRSPQGCSGLKTTSPSRAAIAHSRWSAQMNRSTGSPW
jgi:hypothetical protein